MVIRGGVIHEIPLSVISEGLEVAGFSVSGK